MIPFPKLQVRAHQILIVTPDQILAQRVSKLIGQLSQSVHYPSKRIVVTSASNEDGFRKEIKDNHFSVIFLDLRFGQAQYKPMVDRIREHERNASIIYISENPEEHIDAAVQDQVDDIIPVRGLKRQNFLRIFSMLELKQKADELRTANYMLKQLSKTDELTKLNNMRGFNDYYGRVLKSNQQNGASFAVIMIDLDEFKEINDTSSHLVGSYVLKQIGRILHSLHLDFSKDCAARFGGDEFIIVLNDCSFERAEKICQQFQDILRSQIFSKEGKSYQVTASVGCAFIEGAYDGKEEDPIKGADVMLYTSKSQGKNRYHICKLRNVVDFDHICSTHAANRDTSSDNDAISRMQYL